MKIVGKGSKLVCVRDQLQGPTAATHIVSKIYWQYRKYEKEPNQLGKGSHNSLFLNRNIFRGLKRISNPVSISFSLHFVAEIPMLVVHLNAYTFPLIITKLLTNPQRWEMKPSGPLLVPVPLVCSFILSTKKVVLSFL